VVFRTVDRDGERVRVADPTPTFAQRFYADLPNRVKTESACHVVETEDVPPNKLTFLPEGSISIFVAEVGSAALTALRVNLEAKKYDQFREALGKQLDRLPKLANSKTKVFQNIAAVPVFGEVSYAGKTLSTAFQVHRTLPVNFAFLPYLGGKLKHDSFKLTQYAKGHPKPLEALVVLRKPELTRVERDLLKKIPPSKVDMMIGDPGEYFLCIRQVTVAYLTLAATLYAAKIIHDRLVQQQQEETRDTGGPGGDNADGPGGDNADGPGGDDAGGDRDGAGADFTRELADLAYGVGLGELAPGAAAKDLLAIRTKYVGRLFSR
jgi:hypothetical protein